MRNSVDSLKLLGKMRTCVASSEPQNGAEDSGEAEPQEDYTSKVPKFTFANTIEEQEEQLRTNPLMLRFRESRKKLAKDPHVPLYHLLARKTASRGSLSGRAVGTCSTRDPLPKTRASTGVTRVLPLSLSMVRAAILANRIERLAGILRARVLRLLMRTTPVVAEVLEQKRVFKSDRRARPG